MPLPPYPTDTHPADRWVNVQWQVCLPVVGLVLPVLTVRVQPSDTSLARVLSPSLARTSFARTKGTRGTETGVSNGGFARPTVPFAVPTTIL